MSCTITGEAVVEEHHDTELNAGRVANFRTPLPPELRWVKADPAIHVSEELLAAGGRAFEFVKTKYEIGERCCWNPHSFHARLIDSGG